MPTLNGYYEDDFEKKRLVIKTLLEEKGVSWEDLNILMGGTLIKWCSGKKMSNGKYFWYNWGTTVKIK